MFLYEQIKHIGMQNFVEQSKHINETISPQVQTNLGWESVTVRKKYETGQLDIEFGAQR